MNKTELISNLTASHYSFWNTASLLPNSTNSINGKWSAAQNVQHINIGLSRISNYLAVPKSSIETNFGWSERNSKSYDIMIKMFNNAFENGVQSTDSFLPDENLQTKMKDLISQGKESLDAVLESLQNWSEDDLEKYNCPHPFLGKITVREILYFTIYHVEHHHKTLLKM